MNGLSSSISATALPTPIPHPTNSALYQLRSHCCSSCSLDHQPCTRDTSNHASHQRRCRFPNSLFPPLSQRDPHIPRKTQPALHPQVFPGCSPILRMVSTHARPLISTSPLLGYRHRILHYLRMDVANIPACRRHQSTGVRRHATAYVTLRSFYFRKS